MEVTRYEDLYDAEKRPGAGVALWTKGVEHQLARVRAVGYRHRLNHSPHPDEKRDDPDAEWQLHCDVYFLALAIRRVVLFHDLFSRGSGDARLKAARRVFDQAAPSAKALRDFLEHLDEYLLDSPRKHMNFPGRAAPVLRLRWQADNVLVLFGPYEVDVTLAAVAAIELGRATTEVWEEHLAAALAARSHDEPPDRDDGVPRVLELTMGRSTIIGDASEREPEIVTGTLLAGQVRDATAQEIADLGDGETGRARSAPDG